MTHTIERRFFDISGMTVTEAEDETTPKRLEGYAAVFDSRSENFGDFVEVIKPGAFTRSLRSVANDERKIHALWSHIDAMPLGSTATGKLTLREDDTGLWFSLDTSRMTPAQLDACRDGDVKMSFGFRIAGQNWHLGDDGMTIRDITEADLFEVSPVINPAYSDTSAALRSMSDWHSSQIIDDQASVDELYDNSNSQRRSIMRFKLMALERQLTR